MRRRSTMMRTSIMIECCDHQLAPACAEEAKAAADLRCPRRRRGRCHDAMMPAAVALKTLPKDSQKPKIDKLEKLDIC